MVTAFSHILMSRQADSNQFPAVTTQQVVADSRAASWQSRAELAIAYSRDRTRVGCVIPLESGPVLVGRDVEAPGISIADPHVSRTHLRIVRDLRTGQLRLGDAMSRNKTYVRGLPVEAATLEEGDVIRIGDSVLIYAHPTPMAETDEHASRLAFSDLNLLVLGETGVGKEVLARRIHEQSGRRGPFVAINCATLPRDIIGSELFGHSRGAFSGATQARRGLVQAADGGTLFLDEVGDLPLEQQAVLLRVLEQRTVRPIGADAEIPVDLRVIAAAHEDLEATLESQRFRKDLFARLRQSLIRIPPLRQRRAQILPLLQTLANRDGPLDAWLSADAAEALCRWDWPLNVRELNSLARSFDALRGKGTLDLDFLVKHDASLTESFRPSTDAEQPAMDKPHGRPTRASLESALRKHGGNLSAVAAELGKPRSQVYRWLSAMGLSAGRFRR